MDQRNASYDDLPILLHQHVIKMKLQKLVEIAKIGWNCENWLILWKLVEIVKIGWNCENWLKLWKLVEIVKIGWNCENWSKL